MAEVSPKAWIVNAMNTKPGIMNAWSWTQAIQNVEFKQDQELNSIQRHGLIMPWTQCLGSCMHRAECKQEKMG